MNSGPCKIKTWTTLKNQISERENRTGRSKTLSVRDSRNPLPFELKSLDQFVYINVHFIRIGVFVNELKSDSFHRIITRLKTSHEDLVVADQRQVFKGQVARSLDAHVGHIRIILLSR